MKVYAAVAAFLASFIVGLLALATASAPPLSSPQDRAAGVEPIRPTAPSPTGPASEGAPKTGSPGAGTAPSDSKQEASPVLDVPSLEKRLRETKAIGFFTKLSLKNQLDDLMEQFRAFHEARSGAALVELRERYNLLLLKVLSVLQDSDPALAGDISASREALWSLLADPAKFKKL